MTSIISVPDEKLMRIKWDFCFVYYFFVVAVVDTFILNICICRYGHECDTGPAYVLIVVIQ